MKKFYTILFFAFYLNYSYSQQDKKDSPIENIDTLELSEKSVTPLELINKQDTLIISFEGTDCGEWGGHQETIFLHRQENGKIIARIIIDKVPCDDIIKRNGVGILNPKKRKIILDYTKILELKDEQLFSNFLQRLLELYLKPMIIGNYGSYYVVRNTDNSLYFSYWNSGDFMDTHFENLKKEVFKEYK